MFQCATKRELLRSTDTALACGLDQCCDTSETLQVYYASHTTTVLINFVVRHSSLFPLVSSRNIEHIARLNVLSRLHCVLSGKIPVCILSSGDTRMGSRFELMLRSPCSVDGMRSRLCTVSFCDNGVIMDFIAEGFEGAFFSTY